MTSGHTSARRTTWFRFADAFRDDATLQRPKAIEHQGTARIFSTEWFEQCDPVYRFKVVVETRRGGDNNKVMGIVTAVQDFR